ncbi:divergent polysaccharide deacetylase family protein [Marinomonas sp.]|uniref:divergent polysaccharide deacetylase family protein n=1 Tax=Marinomonas sp. TaxID=1904862 RepID=UPI003BAD10F2
MFDFKKFVEVVFCLLFLSGGVNASETALDRLEYVSIKSPDELADQGEESASETFFEVSEILPEHLGPVIVAPKSKSLKQSDYPFITDFPKATSHPMFDTAKPWVPAIVPFLDAPIIPEIKGVPSVEKFNIEHKQSDEEAAPAKKLAVDAHPKMPKIAILIDDLGYNRQGMESSLLLPTEVALAILPSTPFATKTALAAQKQKRITLLHAPMENQRELKLGPGGLYAKMTEHELKETLSKDLDGLPGIQGVNNHMGSLLTTKADSMKWVMETLKGRSLFFIDSLTSPKSVAKKTAQEYGLDTVSRDVFLDNIRTEKAIDRQFSRLLKLARLHGSALAIGHPYPETMDYLKKRLNNLELDGVRLVRLSDLLISSPSEPKLFQASAKK